MLTYSLAITMFNLQEVHTIEELLSELKASKIDHDLDKVQQAFDYAEKVHVGELRKNGDPRSYHLLTTAAYLARLNLDTTSVICGLLHEVLEKDKSKLAEIDNKFGTEVAFIIDGLTNVKYQSEAFDTHNEDPANFRHLMMNSVDDIRVLLVRLANKLHNVQTLDVLAPDRKRNQANKILLIYAPLCEYLGLGQFQSIFETLAFKALQPEEYQLISNHIEKLGKDLREQLDSLTTQISDFSAKYHLQIHNISSRTKNVYSAYRKIKQKYMQPGEQLTEKHLHKIKDLLGIRVIVNTIEECYVLLGLIHENWEYYPEEFDDYIIKPKISGYKSIHTVINFEDAPVEIQIRTAEMHEYNEFGPASHIAYKLQSQSKQKTDHTWTKDLLKWKQGKLTKEDFQIKAFAESIFVFTPKGKIIKLDKGANLLDFAFHIHTELAACYTGAKVNGTMRAMNWELKTGDIVEVLHGKQWTINPQWLQIATMNVTRMYVRKLLRNG